MRRLVCIVLSNLCVATSLVSSGMHPSPVSADIFRANHRPHFSIGKPYGNCYARSVPRDAESLEGWTQVYQFTNTRDDTLLFEFPWYGLRIHLNCPDVDNMGSTLSLVREGMWPNGQKANDDEMALEFFYGGKKLTSYSTLDIAGSPSNVAPSVSHYRVIEKVVGFREPSIFTILTIDGRTLDFDTTTGKIRE